MTLLYAAFGSNLHPHRLQARISSAGIVGTSVLYGWQLAFHKRGNDGSAKCDVVRSPRTQVHVALYALNEAQKTVLDNIEGVGSGYFEQKLTIEGGRQAFLYVADPEYIAPDLQPFDWYLRYVVEGARWHGFPPEYVHALEQTPFLSDPDRNRAAMNTDVLKG